MKPFNEMYQQQTLWKANEIITAVSSVPINQAVPVKPYCENRVYHNVLFFLATNAAELFSVAGGPVTPSNFSDN